MNINFIYAHQYTKAQLEILIVKLLLFLIVQPPYEVAYLLTVSPKKAPQMLT